MAELTFFVWADTHFGYRQHFGRADFRWQIIEQMNLLPGWPYPPEIGGCVAEPQFIMHCGDVVDGSGSSPSELQFFRHFCSRLIWPQYEICGNHDLGKDYQAYFLDKYETGETRSYSFEAGDWHCLSVDTEYDEDETGRLGEKQLEFIGDDLARLPAGTPVLFFTHTSLNSLKDADPVRELLAPHNVVLAMAGHLHRPAIYRLGKTICVDVGHCRNHPIDPEYGRSFTVVRLSEKHITAIPWRWDLRDWERGQRWTNDCSGRAEDVIARLILDEEL